MPKQPNERMIGIFIISGILAFLAALSLFLKEKLFTDNNQMIVMYFEESIKGLNVGSPVVFKGVEIGKVSKIELLANTTDLDFSIPVYVKMETVNNIYANKSYSSKQAILNALIDKGLRARLTSQSYLTGQLMIELEMLPDTKIALHHQKDDDILEIPTALSPIGELSRGLQTLPLRESVDQFNTFFSELNKQLPVIMPQISSAAAGFNKLVKENSRSSTDALDNFNKAAVSVSEAAKAFRNFADYIERHPEALLKGKGYAK